MKVTTVNVEVTKINAEVTKINVEVTQVNVEVRKDYVEVRKAWLRFAAFYHFNFFLFFFVQTSGHYFSRLKCFIFVEYLGIGCYLL